MIVRIIIFIVVSASCINIATADNNPSIEKQRLACAKQMDEQSDAISAKDWVQLERLSKRYTNICQDVVDSELLSDGYGSISLAFLRMGRPEDALVYANKCLDTFYSSPSCHFSKFSALNILGRKREAKEALRITKAITISELERMEKRKAYITHSSEQELYSSKKGAYEYLLKNRISEYNDSDFE